MQLPVQLPVHLPAAKLQTRAQVLQTTGFHDRNMPAISCVESLTQHGEALMMQHSSAVSNAGHGNKVMAGR